MSASKPEGQIGQRGALDLFAGCTPADLRCIEAVSTIVDVTAGRALCRQGEPNHEFFLIVEGEASVTIDGVDIATLDRGCGFAEIALLTPDGRRTATVAAVAEMTLLVFERRGFAALTGCAPTVARRILRESTRRLAANPDGRGRGAAVS